VDAIPGHLERLPAGGDRFRAELLAHDGRERILLSTAELVAKRGYSGTTIDRIVKRAGVSRATFYEYFDNREACLLECFDEAEGELRRLVDEAVAGAKDWPGQVRAGLTAFLGYVSSNPNLARTCLIESATAGSAAMERYERALRSYEPRFALGRQLQQSPTDLPDTVEDMIVGGLVWMVHRRLLRNETGGLSELLPTMIQFALTPYLGEARAREIATQP
jgi:AcrR family transcriptional regulator